MSISRDKSGKIIDKDELHFNDMIRERPYIISFRSDYKRYWDLFIILIALYNAVWTPLTVSFEYAIETGNKEPFRSIDYAVLGIFASDFFVNFFTSYLIVSSGEIVNKPSMIAVNYILSFDFYIDFLSTFPFETLGN